MAFAVDACFRAIPTAMSALLRAFVAFLLAYSSCVIAACQVESYSTEKLLTDVLAGEMVSESGRLCFRVSFGNKIATTPMPDEAKRTERVVYSWAPGNKFCLVLWGKDGPIRTIVSDGKAIDTGDKIWDARFAFGYNSHGTDESFELELELRYLLWPYFEMIEPHLHPFTGLHPGTTIEQLKELYKISESEGSVTPDSARKDITLRFQMLRMPDLDEVVHVRREAIAYMRSSREGLGLGSAREYERTGLTKVESVGWIPGRCAMRYVHKDLEESKIPWNVSELCSEQPASAVDSADFAVDRSKSPMILWPYGTRVKNAWRNIVNTLTDWW